MSNVIRSTGGPVLPFRAAAQDPWSCLVSVSLSIFLPSPSCQPSRPGPAVTLVTILPSQNREDLEANPSERAISLAFPGSAFHAHRVNHSLKSQLQGSSAPAPCCPCMLPERLGNRSLLVDTFLGPNSYVPFTPGTYLLLRRPYTYIQLHLISCQRAERVSDSFIRYIILNY